MSHPTEPLKLRYWNESCDIGPLGGEAPNVRMVTSAPAITTDIYCEQPYCSADGSRLAMLRHYRLGSDTSAELLVYDIPRYKVGLLSNEVVAVANAGYSGILYVTVGRGKDARLVRFNLNTLERTELPELSDNTRGQVPHGKSRGVPGLHSVSPDQRFGVSGGFLGNSTFGIFLIDLETGEHRPIYQSSDIANPHLQFRPLTGNRLLVQENRDATFDEDGNFIKACGKRGVGLVSMTLEGSDRKEYPVGPPHTPSTTGHESWIGDSDNVLVTVSDYYDDGKNRGTLLEVSHDRPRPRVVSVAPHKWNHISVSKCGRYFVTDSYDLRSTPIIVGSIATGKWKVLCEPHTTGGGAQYSHLHPYMTSDNRWVVFNSDRTGLAQVYIAEVRDEFLRGLD